MLSPGPQPSSAPAGLATVATLVEARLRSLLDAELVRWPALTPDLRDPIESLLQLVMSGGKRLRPAFCYWAFVGAGGDPDDPAVIDAGAAFELLQAFALVHDDIMDGSATRRGFRTAHLSFADRHVAETWRGEDRRFGEGVAILIGDLAHVYADMLLRDVPRSVLEVWDELRVELNVGQYLDILGTARGDRDLEATRLIARYKSGKYTIERPLHLGAALTGRYHELGPALSSYGDPLGEAFQLRDDVLGAFGHSEVTGKPVGDDLREGKPTPILAWGVTHGTAADRAVFERVGAPDLTDDEIVRIQDSLRTTGALDAAEARIDSLTTSAIEAVQTAPLSSEAVDALVDLARFVAWRQI